MDRGNPRTWGTRAAWLVAPVLLLATAAGVAVVLRGPAALVGWVITGLVLLALAWTVISTLWPARAERECPDCGEDALERLDPDTTCGVVCQACGYRDDSQSSWLLAEEEGPLEDVVLRQRGRGRPTQSSVDRPLPAD
ncbi:MAG: hypothetical protein O7B99_12375 [Planctomycetota bacterium]|nr:hypothetical protein [Planctomycetota bacterium]